MFIRILLILTTVLVLTGVPGPGEARAGTARPGAGEGRTVERGRVVFSASAVVGGNAGPADRQALIAAIQTSWERYLRQDTSGYTALLAEDVTRLSQRAGRIQQGRAAVAAGMADEWRAFERPGDIIAEDMTIQRAELVVNPGTPATATALYWVDVAGGARWSYTDQGLVFQTFEKVGETWTITHQTDTWALSHDPEAGAPQETFDFDYVYPVQDLNRALAFYRPILGAPERATADRAWFNLGGPRFVLDAGTLSGLSVVRRGLPSGYAAFLVRDVAAERERLMAAGVSFLAGTGTTLKTRDGDTYAIARDPSGNVFVLLQKNLLAESGGVDPVVTGFAGTDPHILAAKALAESWLRADAEGVARRYGADGRWFDDTRLKTRGLERGQRAIAAALSTVYWPRYDRTAGGLIATMEVASVQLRRVGPKTLVSYRMSLNGRGHHGFQDTAFVTHVFDGPERVAQTFIVANNRPSGMVLELDYTGYPVTNLGAAERFYTDTLRLGRPYRDEDWRGYWSDRTVFGIYTADPDEDGIPQANRSNGYISFWIKSARATYDYLREVGSAFPVIPAINDESGMSSEPGYTQIVATDSEGNVAVFTEYSGRRGR